MQVAPRVGEQLWEFWDVHQTFWKQETNSCCANPLRLQRFCGFVVTIASMHTDSRSCVVNPQTPNFFQLAFSEYFSSVTQRKEMREQRQQLPLLQQRYGTKMLVKQPDGNPEKLMENCATHHTGTVSCGILQTGWQREKRVNCKWLRRYPALTKSFPFVPPTQTLHLGFDLNKLPDTPKIVAHWNASLHNEERF